MGLDMYVTIRHKDTQSKLEAYEAWENKYSYEEYELLTDEQREEHCNSEPEYDEDMYGKQLIYWRKANQIHNWFVKNCQNGVDDCGRYIVTLNQLKELKELCEKIMTMTDGENLTIEGGKFAEENLPSRSGFFFGSTDYDEYYVYDVKYTANELVEVIRKVEEEYNEDYIIEYTSSW